MEEEHIDNIQKENSSTSKQMVKGEGPFLGLSFTPPELDEKGGVREKFAVASVVIGGISLVSWVVILLGIFISLLGIVLATLGLKSQQARRAKIGLGLSIAGLIITILYIVAAARGMVPYSYFTSGIATN